MTESTIAPPEEESADEDAAPAAPAAKSVYGQISIDELDRPEYDEAEFDQLAQMYDESFSGIKEGEVVQGRVVGVQAGEVLVDIGFKSEGMVAIKEFGDDLEAIAIGREVEVFLEIVEDLEGRVVLSKQKADFMRVWDEIKASHDSGNTVKGKLQRRIKGGIVVDLFGVEAFLPGSQIDIRQVKNFDQFLGKEFDFKIIKLNKARRNIVVSRRAVLEEERECMRQQIITELEDGQIREGDVMLLPPGIPHSPQRGANTVGMVVERKRPETMEDQFVVYCEKCDHQVFHSQFHLVDIVRQLKPLMENFWSDEANRTCSNCGAVVQPAAKSDD